MEACLASVMPFPVDLIKFIRSFCDTKSISSAWMINQIWWISQAPSVQWFSNLDPCRFCDAMVNVVKYSVNIPNPNQVNIPYPNQQRYYFESWEKVCEQCEDGCAYLVAKYEKLFKKQILTGYQIWRPKSIEGLSEDELALRNFASQFAD